MGVYGDVPPENVLEPHPLNVRQYPFIYMNRFFFNINGG